MRYFLTGGAGFIGSHIAERLLSQGVEVVVFDNLLRNALGRRKILGRPGFQLVEGDVRDREAVTRAMRGADTVVHLAAIAGVQNYSKYPLETMDVNFEGTKTVLQAAATTGVRRIVNFSTSEVYGPQAKNVSEDDPTAQGKVGEFRWTYAVSKLAAEHLCFSFARETELAVISIRPFNIYGPGQVGEGAIEQFVNAAVKGKPLTIYGKGTQVRAWCFIDDFLEAFFRLIETEKAVGKTINVGNPGEVVSVYELARLVKKLSGSSSELVFCEHPSTDIEIRIPDISLLYDLTAFEPEITLEEGIRRVIEEARRENR